MKEKSIERAIRLTWVSLESHLYYIHKATKRTAGVGDVKHNKKCVKEYAEVIKILSDLL